MSAAPKRRVLADVASSTRPRLPDMLRKASARPERGRMSAQREFSDGEVIPGTRYRVVTLIGAGGMGSVYEVEHVELGKRFVLKALLRNLTNRDDLVHRLRNEWRALGKLEHPNIVSVTDAGITSTGLPYFVMERLKGETLAACLRRDRRLPVRRALTVAADVLDGLSVAHRIDIVHRDVKPPNVFLVTNRPAKLLDFGIAKMLDPKASQITGRGIAIGTPRYMAPEQATGEAVDPRTDLYSVGLLLFEMIAGTGPFDSARDSNEIFLAHIAKTAPPLSSLAPFAPAALDHWLAKMLAKKPADRPADAATVSAALRALAAELASGPRKAPEPPKEERTLDGGPFDTLEGAQTVPSDGAPAPFAETRTGIGPPRASDRAPVWNADAAQSGQTLQIDAVTSGDELPTHTAVPVMHPQTPPPVSETPPPMRAERHWGKVGLVATACVALGAGAAFSVRYTRGATLRAMAESVERKAAGIGAREPVAVAPSPVAVTAPAKAEPAATSSAKLERAPSPVPVKAHSPVAARPAEAPAAEPPPASSGISMIRMHDAPAAPAVSAAPKPKRAKAKASPDDSLPGSGL
jgi:serine/threonine-protein kinase